DHLAYSIQLADGEEITALLQADSGDEIRLASAAGRVALPKSRVKSIRLAGVSLMPEGLDKALSGPQLKDLMTFLLTQPLEPAPAEAPGEPPPRQRAEMDAVLKEIAASKAVEQPPFPIILCAGPKDHGPGEHDYPLWQKRWATLLALGEGVAVSTAWEWPSAEQWQAAQVIVFYSDNPGWSRSRADELGAYLSRGGGAVFVH